MQFFLGFKRFQWAKYQEKDAILDFYVILFNGGISIILFSKNLFNEKKVGEYGINIWMHWKKRHLLYAEESVSVSHNAQLLFGLTWISAKTKDIIGACSSEFHFFFSFAKNNAIVLKTDSFFSIAQFIL